jgi:23S rRNA (adenine2503-C2)-methyltransferase
MNAGDMLTEQEEHGKPERRSGGSAAERARRDRDGSVIRYDLQSLTPDELQAAVRLAGEKSFRAKQIYQWLHEKLVSSPEEMTNVPKRLRDVLTEQYPFVSPETRAVQVSKIDGTRKYLFCFADNCYVEAVYMIYQHGHSVCISTQNGCRMGCRFCASTIGGLTRNLSAGEMLEQVYAIQRDTGERVSNIVLMGTGEPLDNYANVVRFIRMVTGPGGLNISERNITLSTCGIVPGILKLRDENLMINLALSLHAPNDQMRREIMPIANRYSLSEIIPALKSYYSVNRRRLTFEYSLIHGVNDSDDAARQIAALIRGMNALVNLIPVNPVREAGFQAPDRTHVLNFKKKLENYGIHVTIRREMGRDIDGACGQLRKRCSEMETDR